MNAYAGELLTYTSGPAQGQVIWIVSNTANSITTVSAFNPVPTAGGGDSFTIINPGVPVVQGQSSTTALLVALVNGNPLPFDTYYYVVASPMTAFSGYARFLPVQASGTATINAAQPATTVQLDLPAAVPCERDQQPALHVHGHADLDQRVWGCPPRE